MSKTELRSELCFYLGGVYMQEIFNVYISFVQEIMPWMCVFGFGNMIVATLLRAIFGGRLVIK